MYEIEGGLPLHCWDREVRISPRAWVLVSICLLCVV